MGIKKKYYQDIHFFFLHTGYEEGLQCDFFLTDNILSLPQKSGLFIFASQVVQSIDKGIWIAVGCQNGTLVIQTQVNPASVSAGLFANGAKVVMACKKSYGLNTYMYQMAHLH